MPLPPEIELHLAKELSKCEPPRSDAEIISIIEDVLMDVNIDHAHWEEAQAIRKDLAFLRDTRERCEGVTGKAIVTVVGTMIAGIVFIIALGIREWIEHG
jgi:hypothetical protein